MEDTISPQIRDQRLLLWILLRGGDGGLRQGLVCTQADLELMWSKMPQITVLMPWPPGGWRTGAWTDLIETETAMEVGVRRGMKETQQLTQCHRYTRTEFCAPV